MPDLATRFSAKDLGELIGGVMKAMKDPPSLQVGSAVEFIDGLERKRAGIVEKILDNGELKIVDDLGNTHFVHVKDVTLVGQADTAPPDRPISPIQTSRDRKNDARNIVSKFSPPMRV